VNEIGPAAKKLCFDATPTRLLLTGRSTLGKTTLAVDLILTRFMKNVNRCFACCPTWYQQKTLAPLREIPGAFPKKNVFTRVDDSVFEHIFQQLTKFPCPTLLFVDDAAAEAATNKGNKGSFSRLCLAAPHLQLSIVGCFQRLTQASPAFRDNTEGIISFIPSKLQDVETLCEEFNPCPARKRSKDIVKRALDYGWRNARFCFIYREAFTGKIYYFSGLNDEIDFESTSAG
jgi:hypothetical protein